MSSRLLFALVVLSLCGQPVAQADSANSTGLDRYRLTIGLSFNSVDFDIYPQGNLNPAGTLSEDYHTTPFVNLSGPPSYFEDSSFGWYFEYSLSRFALSQQLVNDKLVDLDSSVSGYDIYIAPTLFYSFNGPFLLERASETINFGVGAGIGYLKASGDIVLTNTGGQRLAIDIANAGMAVVIFVEYQAGHFHSRISGGGTSYTDAGLDYDAFGFVWSVGYSF